VAGKTSDVEHPVRVVIRLIVCWTYAWNSFMKDTPENWTQTENTLWLMVISCKHLDAVD